MKVDLYTNTGAKSGTLEVPQTVFGVKINEVLMAQSRRVFLSNQRRAHAKSKTRGQVSGSGKKIWRQKGTGRARHGDRYANIFVGGGVAHGPTGLENYTLKLTKKMRRAALASALSKKLANEKTVFVKGLDKIQPKTRSAAQLLGKLNLKNKRITVVVADGSDHPRRAMRNLERVNILPAAQLNAYRVMVGGQLLVMSEAVSILEKLCTGKEAKPIKKEVKKVAK